MAFIEKYIYVFIRIKKWFKVMLYVVPVLRYFSYGPFAIIFEIKYDFVQPSQETPHHPWRSPSERKWSFM